MRILLVSFLVLFCHIGMAQRSATPKTEVIAIPYTLLSTGKVTKYVYPPQFTADLKQKTTLAFYSTNLERNGWNDPHNFIDTDVSGYMFIVSSATHAVQLSKVAGARVLDVTSFEDVLGTELYDKKEYEIADQDTLLELLAKQLRGEKFSPSEQGKLVKSNPKGIYRKVPSIKDLINRVLR